MERIDSDDERIQLRSVSEVASMKMGTYLARASSSIESDLGKLGRAIPEGITVTTEVETRFHPGQGREHRVR